MQFYHSTDSHDEVLEVQSTLLKAEKYQIHKRVKSLYICSVFFIGLLTFYCSYLIFSTYHYTPQTVFSIANQTTLDSTQQLDEVSINPVSKTWDQIILDIFNNGIQETHYRQDTENDYVTFRPQLASVTAAASQSYGNLAATKLGAIHDQLITHLSDISSQAAPSDVYAVRKVLGSTFQLLQIFYAAYGADGKHNWFKKLAETVHHGYDILGDYQDLGHVGPDVDQNDMIKRLQDCLKWKEEYIHLEKRFDVEAYLTHPSHTLYTGESRKLSPHLWGTVSARPSLKLSGLDNVIVLFDELLKNIGEVERRILEIDSILIEESHEQFHAFRKYMRVIIAIATQFPNVFIQTSAVLEHAQTGIQAFQNLYDQYGDLNDIWTAYHYYQTKADESRYSNPKYQTLAKRYAQQTVDGWNHLKRLQQQYVVGSTARDLRKTLNRISSD